MTSLCELTEKMEIDFFDWKDQHLNFAVMFQYHRNNTLLNKLLLKIVQKQVNKTKGNVFILLEIARVVFLCVASMLGGDITSAGLNQ